MKKVILTFLCLVFFNCSVKTLISENEYKVKGITLKGDSRITYVKYDVLNKRTYTLSEPPPDAILEKATKLANSLTLKNETSKTDLATDQKVELASKVISLGERSVAVNILRDALFRLSEMNVNNSNVKLEDSYKVLFDSILSVSKQIALADKAKAEAQKMEAEVKKINSLGVADLETQAFEQLISKELEKAKISFEKAYQIYPTYHNIKEIKDLLSDYDDDTIKMEEWNSIYKKIVEQFSWKMPKEIKDKFKKLIN